MKLGLVRDLKERFMQCNLGPKHGTTTFSPLALPLSEPHVLLGISKPRFCQTYVLQFGAFHENDGNHENGENDKGNSDSHKQGGLLLDLRKSRKARK